MKEKVVFDIHSLVRSAFLKKPVNSDSHKFDRLLEGSNKVLLKISTVFPLDFFPDEITIDQYKVSIVFHEFFFSEDIHSINIEMIRDVDVEAGPFFAKLKIVPDGFPVHILEICYLKKKEAIRARRIIQGLMVAKRHGVDPIKLEGDDLAEKFERLGESHLAE